MNIYTFCGQGLALRSVVVVRANGVMEAYHLAKQWAQDNGVPVTSIELTDTKSASADAEVVYAWNGDY